MRKVLFLLIALLFILNKPCSAIDRSDDLLAMIRLTPGVVTQDKVTAMFGKPVTVEENNRKTYWHYTRGSNKLTICWNNKSDVLEKYSFTSEQVNKPCFDGNVCRKLKSGTTDLNTALKMLGTPKDMTIKKMTQEMHYTYQKSVLRLFFRDRVLVDYTLLSQK